MHCNNIEDIINRKWDYRFLEMAKLISTWSKDPSTKCGSVIVRPNKTICSTGFNGFPQKMEDNPDLYENRDEKYPRVIHAEMNSLLFSAESVKGYTIYIWPMLPCERCFIHLVQAGITRFISQPCPEDKIDRWEKQINKVKNWAREMKQIEITELMKL